MLLESLNRLKLHWTDTIAALEKQSQTSQMSLGPGRLNYQVIGVLVLATVLISILEYYGSSNSWNTLEPLFGLFTDDPEARLREIFRRGEYARLYRLSYWSGMTTLAYLIIPVIWVKFIMRERLRDFGFSIKGAFKHWYIYIAMYLIVLPAVYIVAQTESFQRTYPFYEFANRSYLDFFAWQLVYGMQFLALEFFYRGFLIHGLKARFGLYAIFISTIPYCMIHFGKPLPETLGAIIAGVALGALALYTRTIWLGVAIHISVAVTMDILSLVAQGKLGGG
ncbi:MAG: type II CAAX prenyl endopeptidase Rce1 family protein [Bradymonadaceae bacterium]